MVKKFSPPLPLLTLTDELRSATLGASNFHSPVFQNMVRHYHENGYQWRQERLEIFFREGLLSHYFGRISGINLSKEDNYLKSYNAFLADLNYRFNDRELTPRIRKPVQISPLFKLLHKLKSIPLLSKKGGDYQRLKQWNEVYHTKIAQNAQNEKFSENEILVKKMLENDREMDVLQLEIYNWIRHFHAEVIYFITEICNKNYQTVEDESSQFQPELNLYPDRPVILQDVLNSKTPAVTPVPVTVEKQAPVTEVVALPSETIAEVVPVELPAALPNTTPIAPASTPPAVVSPLGETGNPFVVTEDSLRHKIQNYIQTLQDKIAKSSHTVNGVELWTQKIRVLEAGLGNNLTKFLQVIIANPRFGEGILSHHTKDLVAAVGAKIPHFNLLLNIEKHIAALENKLKQHPNDAKKTLWQAKKSVLELSRSSLLTKNVSGDLKTKLGNSNGLYKAGWFSKTDKLVELTLKQLHFNKSP